ncbi:MAG: hypothetical protein OXM02_08150 [Bacteroidota bacterium]|nr:hypothetical protein [Bacteroidota bacterium]
MRFVNLDGHQRGMCLRQDIHCVVWCTRRALGERPSPAQILRLAKRECLEQIASDLL